MPFMQHSNIATRKTGSDFDLHVSLLNGLYGNFEQMRVLWFVLCHTEAFDVKVDQHV